MSDHLYHYSVSLLRGGSADWIIEPVDASIRAVYQECLNQNPGNSYLAIKTVAGLTYCVFLSGDSCHADVCGWIISLNGWGILDIDTHLCLSQVVWEQFANTSVLDTRASLNDFLLRLVELHGLISKSSPFLINRDIDTPCIVKKVTPLRKLLLLTIKVSLLTSLSTIPLSSILMPLDVLAGESFGDTRCLIYSL